MQHLACLTYRLGGTALSLYTAVCHQVFWFDGLLRRARSRRPLRMPREGCLPPRTRVLTPRWFAGYFIPARRVLPARPTGTAALQRRPPPTPAPSPTLPPPSHRSMVRAFLVPA